MLCTVGSGGVRVDCDYGSCTLHAESPRLSIKHSGRAARSWKVSLSHAASSHHTPRGRATTGRRTRPGISIESSVREQVTM